MWKAVKSLVLGGALKTGVIAVNRRVSLETHSATGTASTGF